jgi:hypothetical protein
MMIVKKIVTPSEIPIITELAAGLINGVSFPPGF